MRTFEVPACGGCMLAERTDDHARFFDEGRDALFFDTPESLVRQARQVAADRPRRNDIALSGHRRVVRDGHTYSRRLEAILHAV
jgi:spore maturation protein CgeB